ncbi:MAG: hypothetical protein R3C13_06375 [Hyphomonas sp.]|uniref:hypothetical protein n=1 Tax=Hyphomonas sp. TaxID=87 RepID=UPI0035287F18
MKYLFLAAGLALLSACSPHEGAGGPYDYCAAGKTNSLFLIDRTTPADSMDKSVMMDSLATVVDGLGHGDRIVVATIGEHYTGTERLVNACKPGCPDNQGAVDYMLGQCSAMQAKADERVFMAQLVKALEPVTTDAEEAKTSDIVRTVAQWTQNPPGGRAFSTVYIFSDMLENSQVLPWREFKASEPEASMETVEKYRLTPDLPGADVHIVGFGRSHDPGRPPLDPDVDFRVRTFWKEYFAAGGATVSFEGTIQN